MPLVLVHNDVVANPAHSWNDVEGVHYHYPPKYKGKIKSGELFVYYRGVHRVGGKRGQAEYVGFGRIGEIWPDNSIDESGKLKKAYYCAIEDYQRFTTPVPAKIDDKPLEEIPKNLWRDGVRSLDQSVFNKIIDLSNIDAIQSISTKKVELSITPSDGLIVPPKINSSRSSGPSNQIYRKSKRSKEVGDWAEAVVLRFLEETRKGINRLSHRAAMGETPGWDIDFEDTAGKLQLIEVKGTISSAFIGVDLTANEKKAAEMHGASYWLYLVADCLTDNPKIQTIQNPAEKLQSGEWTSEPAVYTVRFQPMVENHKIND
jgi:hypothetical protein